jgi:hypothetical protein
MIADHLLSARGKKRFLTNFLPKRHDIRLSDSPAAAAE